MSRRLKIVGLYCRKSSLYRALLQKRPIILRSLVIEATPYRFSKVKLRRVVHCGISHGNGISISLSLRHLHLRCIVDDDWDVAILVSHCHIFGAL